MEYYLGEIRVFPYNSIPTKDGWRPCSGQLLSIAQNQALFSLLGTYYGGDGRVNFALPNLNGRVGLGTGLSPAGTAYELGETGGAENVTLLPGNLPIHNHTFTASTSYNVFFPTNANYIGNPNTPNNPPRTNLGTVNLYNSGGQITAFPQQAISNTGGTQPHENRMPYMAMIYCIAILGTYPSRS